MRTESQGDDPLHEANDRLEDLLLQWEESIAAGLLISAAELCRDCPELIEGLEREIIRLRTVDRFIFPRQSTIESNRHYPRVPGYDILQEIGRGGMGVVYRARQLSLGRLVAIKTLDVGRLGYNDFVVRMRQEAKALSQMNHPNIVQVFDVIETPDNVGLVLEYIDGETLASKLNGKPISASEAARIALTLARTLVEVHEQGLLHRDIKPANVLIDHSGQIKLADFGLVKEEGIAPGVTLAGGLIGSPNYMAPEQADGRAASVDARTDVYGLGTTLYEMLTGRPPFIGASTIDILDQVRQRDPVTLRQLNPVTPRDLETICHRCLEKSPSRRFASARELCNELERFLQGKPIRSRSVRGLDRGWRWCRRHPAFAGMATLSLLAVMLIAVLLALNYRNLARFNLDLKRLNDELSLTAQYAQEMRQVAEDREQQAMRSLYIADIARAATAWKQADTMELMDVLGRHHPKPGEPDLRGFEWWFLRRQANVARRVLIDVGTPIYFIGHTPHPPLMVCAGRDSIVRLFDPDTGRIQRQFSTNQIEVNGVAFSPDGREMATSGDDGTIRIFNLGSGSERLKIQAQPAKSFQVHFTPDGRRIVSCGTDPIIRVFDVESGVELFKLEGHRGTVESIAIIDAGRTLVSTSDDLTVRVWDLQTRQQIHSFDASGDAGPVVVLPDRRILVVGNGTGAIQTFNFESGQEIAAGKHLDRMGSLALHPDGVLLAAGDSSGQIRLRKINRDGKFEKNSYQPWQAHSGNVFSLVWSTDGSRLYSAGEDGRVISWRLAEVQPAGPRSFAIDRCLRFQMMPETNLMLTSSTVDGRTTLWDWTLGMPLGKSSENNLIVATASADGKFVAAIDHFDSLLLFAFSGTSSRPFDGGQIASWRSEYGLHLVRFAPDSKSVAVSGATSRSADKLDENTIWLLSLPDLKPKIRLPLLDVKNLAFSPDGSKLAVTMRESVACWDLREMKSLWEFPLKSANLVEFSPDGEHVAASGFQRTVVVRNTVSGETVRHMANHRTTILAMAYSPDGRLLATSAQDGTIKLWSTGGGQELVELRVEGSVHHLRFSDDGTRLVCQLRNDQDEDHDTILIFDGSPLDLGVRQIDLGRPGPPQ